MAAAIRIVVVENICLVLTRVIREQLGLGAKIVFHVTVVIQMILRDVGQPPASKSSPATRYWSSAWEDTSMIATSTSAFFILNSSS